MIVDFTHVPPGAHILANVGPDEPFSGGSPELDFLPADAGTTGQVLQFRVRPGADADSSTPPMFLKLPGMASLSGGSVRPLALIEQESEYFPEPAEALLGTLAFGHSGAGAWRAEEWDAAVTTNPSVGRTEVWEFYNTTADAHPMHVHEVLFQVMNRQAIRINPRAQTVRLANSPPRPPEPWEAGWKDTVIAYPGEVTRIRMRFQQAGQFVWHCHIVEHEDNEMMRPYRIGPPQQGQPE